MIVIVCPGQGSQTPGFLAPWLELDGAEETLAVFSEAAGVDLRTAGVDSDADTIRDTQIAQPLIVAAGLLTLRTLLADGRRDRVGGIAGHSVGEITAAGGAGILTETEALTLVGSRGRAMAAAAAEIPTGMSAVLGGDQEAVLARLAELELEPANMNGGGQIVAAGALPALEALQAEPAAGTRVIPLAVAGAFHTRYMGSAVAAVQPVAAALAPAAPSLPIWTNRDGGRVDDGTAFVELLVGQIASPVRWDLTMESLAAAGVTGIIEVAPAGTLVGLAKRALKGVPTVAVKTPDDLAAAYDLMEQSA